MPLSSLLQSLISHFYSQPQTVYPEPGLSYGPAMTRISRTPISFTGNMQNPKDVGEYDPNTKTIKVNPMGGSDTGTAIRHEQIHAILDRAPGATAIAQQSAGYPQVAQSLAHVGGDVREEAPAYLGSYPSSQFMGLTDSMRQNFLNDFTDRLNKAAPGVAKDWKRATK